MQEVNSCSTLYLSINNIDSSHECDQLLCLIQLDSSVQTNTIQKKFVLKEQVRPSPSIICVCVYDSAPLKSLGEVDLQVTNLKSNEVMNVTFAVVGNKLQSLLGHQVIQKMNLITVIDETSS